MQGQKLALILCALDISAGEIAVYLDHSPYIVKQWLYRHKRIPPAYIPVVCFFLKQRLEVQSEV